MQQQQQERRRRERCTPSGIRLIAQLTGLPALERHTDEAGQPRGVWLSLGPEKSSSECLAAQARRLQALLADERAESAALARRSMAGLRDVRALASQQRQGKRPRTDSRVGVIEPSAKRHLH